MLSPCQAHSYCRQITYQLECVNLKFVWHWMQYLLTNKLWEHYTNAMRWRRKVTYMRKMKNVGEIRALVGYYTESSGNPLPMFRDNLSLLSSRVKESRISLSWPLKMGTISCLETSVKDYHTKLRNIPEERRSHQHRGGSLKSRNTGG
jgi:hypothetical protein